MEIFPLELAPVNPTTTGQEISGKLYFTVPADMVTGGDIQPMTGRLVHAIWRV